MKKIKWIILKIYIYIYFFIYKPIIYIFRLQVSPQEESVQICRCHEIRDWAFIDRFDELVYQGMPYFNLFPIWNNKYFMLQNLYIYIYNPMFYSFFLYHILSIYSLFRLRIATSFLKNQINRYVFFSSEKERERERNRTVFLATYSLKWNQYIIYLKRAINSSLTVL